ncbi:RNase H domain-containing protein [Abeliophyllum distichum]|uniref:RNase H domain-containing protein n=1 Tax=Abeliophyllum distichum TaxID=126358 RepID=A0ABD1Q691_9LAMI
MKVEDPRLARPLFITLVYTSCSPVGRKDIWTSFYQISLSVDRSWLVEGDFNVIAHNGERTGKNIRDRGTSKFADMMMDCGLTDAGLVSDEDNLQLNQTPTLTEVYWDIVSEDVYQAVLDFFAEGHLPRDFATTSIVLFPKQDNAYYFSRLLTQQYQHIPSMAYRHRGDALISHLSFVDDMIIFVNDQKQSIRRALQCIEHYECTSRKLVNRDKSGIILPRKFSTSQIHRLEHMTGFHQHQQPFTYLGVPSSKGAKKIFLYDDLV